ncbi:HYR domain-containing protein [Bacillus sp. SB49]|uniref:HYR domain-containing protein n=1 Tax=Bacillus sp. SB49 TaxID=1071080 RepID=UPI0006860B43|nr:HYR domain-containing protein [Bacillus sp. SB49]QHT47939.1 HYR domain-containing protein [Bacillus sp. SB49]
MVTQVFSYTGSLQHFIVPLDVYSLTIKAVGAKGGDYPFTSRQGGLGVSMQGEFNVIPGEILSILAGGAGGDKEGGGRGGGGGSFVWRGDDYDDLNSDNLLIAAGGGGGASLLANGINAVITNSASAGQSGIGSSASGEGGSFSAGGSGGPGSIYGGNGGNGFGGGGGGGGGGISDGAGGGGSGISGNGGAGAPIPGSLGGGDGGTSIISGAAGGEGGSAGPPLSYPGNNGGLGGGGGGGGAYEVPTSGSGGGGGFSGGGGGADEGRSGGGGGSFNAGANQVNLTGVGDGDGLVEITFTEFRIQCPENQIIEVSTGVTGAFVSFPDPQVTGGTSPVTVSCIPSSGSFLSLGTTQVTCRAVDNEGNTVSCGFAVIVQQSSMETTRIRLIVSGEVQVVDDVTLKLEGRVQTRGGNSELTNEVECIKTQRVLDWVSFCKELERDIPIPAGCMEEIIACRNNGGKVSVECEMVEESTRSTVLEQGVLYPDNPDLDTVSIRFNTKIRVYYFCGKSKICTFIVPLSFIDKLVCCYPEGSTVKSNILQVRCCSY